MKKKKVEEENNNLNIEKISEGKVKIVRKEVEVKKKNTAGV